MALWLIVFDILRALLALYIYNDLSQLIFVPFSVLVFFCAPRKRELVYIWILNLAVPTVLFLRPDFLADTVYISIIFYCVAVASLSILHKIFNRKIKINLYSNQVSNRPILINRGDWFLVFAVAFLVMYAVTGVAYRYQTSNMTAGGGIQLPFGLLGLFNHLHLHILPWVVIGLVWRSFTYRSNVNRIWVIVLSIAWLAFEGFARNSRGFTVQAIFLILFLGIIYRGRLRASDSVIMFILVPLGVLSIIGLTLRRMGVSLSSLNTELVVRYAGEIYGRIFSVVPNLDHLVIGCYTDCKMSDVTSAGSFSAYVTQLTHGSVLGHSSGTSFIGEFLFFAPFVTTALLSAVTFVLLINLAGSAALKFNNSTLVVFFVDFTLLSQFLNGGLFQLLFFRQDMLVIMFSTFAVLCYLHRITVTSTAKRLEQLHS